MFQRMNNIKVGRAGKINTREKFGGNIGHPFV